jgi:Pyridoxamine 5'-phosphate oxidase
LASEEQEKLKVEDEIVVAQDRQNLQKLQDLIDRSVRTATPSVGDSVAYPERQMSAAEFVEFWQSVRLVAMATVGEGGRPHLAPVHASLDGVRLRLVIYDNTVRRADIARNPRVSFTTWRADGAAAIVYGRAREIEGSMRPARPGRSGKPRQVVEIEVKLTRVYAMRAPSSP